jgi:hypothetical protein
MIYITEMIPVTRTKKWLHQEAAYVTADTARELHRFALEHKFPTRWFRGHSYQITRTKWRIITRKSLATLVKDFRAFTELAGRMA